MTPVTPVTHWHSGEPIVLREIYDGRVWAVRPVRFVEDTGERVAVYMAEGNRWLRPVASDGSPMRMQADSWRLRETAWAGNSTLRVWTPGKPHSVMLWWHPVSWEFLGWYVNFEEPMRRSAAGFDYADWKLDLIVEPDGRYRWKDEDELEHAAALGLLDADAVWAEAKRVLADPPWPSGWEDWRPDPELPPPRLPGGWDQM